VRVHGIYWLTGELGKEQDHRGSTHCICNVHMYARMTKAYSRRNQYCDDETPCSHSATSSDTQPRPHQCRSAQDEKYTMKGRHTLYPLTFLDYRVRLGVGLVYLTRGLELGPSCSSPYHHSFTHFLESLDKQYVYPSQSLLLVSCHPLPTLSTLLRLLSSNYVRVS
jgi:hypothetical protein